MHRGLEDHMNPAADVVFVEKRTPPRWRLDRNIRLGDVLVIMTIIIIGLLSYRPMEARVAHLEERQMTLERLGQLTSDAVVNLRKIVELRTLLEQDYPPHRHLKNQLMYPSGRTPQTPEKQP
jgi:hypothetical protein